MPGTDANRAYQLVVDEFRALGAADAESIRWTALFRGLSFAGRRFLCDGFQAVWLVGEESVAFYDEQGAHLKTVKLEAQQTTKAA